MKEDKDYLSKQLITYLGNKRSLLPFIGEGISSVKTKLNKTKLTTFDAFSGSGVVARYLKQHSNKIIANDLEDYSKIINQCYLTNKINSPDLLECHNHLLTNLTEESLSEGFITRLYSPEDMDNIKEGERCFYTPRNAKYLDTARTLIEELPEDIQPYFIAPLLSEASIHTNTSGIFKGFHKHKGVGKFGGKGENALSRILSNINLNLPVLSNFYTDEIQIYQEDTNKLITNLEEVDLTYLDPPYNQHPYGSNYFMLNLIANYKEPENISKISGIPTNWNRSYYNKKQLAYNELLYLTSNIKSKYLLISFNSEGFISKEEMIDLLNKVGKVNILETKYNTFRGSRNLKSRSIYVKEYLYLVEKM